MHDHQPGACEWCEHHEAAMAAAAEAARRLREAHPDEYSRYFAEARAAT